LGSFCRNKLSLYQWTNKSTSQALIAGQRSRKFENATGLVEFFTPSAKYNKINTLSKWRPFSRGVADAVTRRGRRRQLSASGETGVAAVSTNPQGPAEHEVSAPKPSPKQPPAVAAIFEQRPVIAGEDGLLYDHLADYLIKQENPQTLRAWFAAKQVADSEWERRRFQKVARSLYDAEIARAVLAQVMASLNDAVDDDKNRQQLQTQWHGIVSAAVSGDKQAIERVEQQIGPGKITIDQATADGIERTLQPHAIVDHLITNAIDRREAGFDELERAALKQSTQRVAHPEVPGAGANMSLAEYARSFITPPKGA
jgi:hypothetical protein